VLILFVAWLAVTTFRPMPPTTATRNQKEHDRNGDDESLHLPAALCREKTACPVTLVGILPVEDGIIALGDIPPQDRLPFP
jgi:hypothetical protein